MNFLIKNRILILSLKNITGIQEFKQIDGELMSCIQKTNGSDLDELSQESEAETVKQCVIKVALIYFCTLQK